MKKKTQVFLRRRQGGLNRFQIGVGDIEPVWML
jgi:hypothetical protein